jgi:hypothetical protein
MHNLAAAAAKLLERAAAAPAGRAALTLVPGAGLPLKQTLLALRGGVQLAGAGVAMMTSALLRNGPDHLRPLEVQVRDWMDRHDLETLEQLRGRLSQRSVPDPAAFERANYIKTLASHPAPGR